MNCPECNGTGKAPCDMCGGNGCVYCRGDLENIKAPEIVEGRMNFKRGEIGEFVFNDRDDADIMVSYLNRRCSFDHSCPEICQKCKPDCVSFKESYVYPYDGKFKIGGFECGNPKLMNAMDNSDLKNIIESIRL